MRVSSDLLARFVGNRGAGEDFRVPFREREPIRRVFDARNGHQQVMDLEYAAGPECCIGLVEEYVPACGSRRAALGHNSLTSVMNWQYYVN